MGGAASGGGRSSAPRTFPLSLRNALDGLVYGFNHGRNFRLQLAAGLLAVSLAFLEGLGRNGTAAIVLVTGLVLGLELMNTALEKAVDLFSPGWNELARLAKDAAAGAVLLTSLVSLALAGLLLWPALPRLSGAGERLSAHPTAGGILAAADLFFLWRAWARR